MSIFTKIGKSLSGFKALTPDQLRFPGQSLVFFDMNRPDVTELANDVGDGTGADVLMTPVRWLQRAIIEAPIVATDADGEPVENNDLVALLEAPNPFYSREVLLAGTVLSLSLDGNAYWLVVQNQNGRPLELWFVPHGNITPRWENGTGKPFIDHYEYDAGASKQKLALEDVVHFREGVDPTNLRKGLSPLKGLLREIWTDNEAAMFTASLLKNGGVPGIVFAPSDKDAALTPDEAEVVKAKIQTDYTRANRGKPMVMLGPTDVHQFGFSPQQLDLSPLRDVSEERVTAALGVPAAVVGFGAGLQATKVGATMKEMRQMAWTNGVLPLQRIIAGEAGRSLGEAFNTERLEFDNKGVQALRENEDTKAARIGRLYRDGVLMRSESRAALGFESTPADDVYMANLSTMFIPKGQAPADDGLEMRSGNGNGATVKWGDTWITPTFSKEHSAAERRIVAAAPRAKPTRAAALLARQIDLIRRRPPKGMEDDLEAVFRRLGRDVGRAANEVLADIEPLGESELQRRAHLTTELKRGELLAGDAALAAAIAEAVDTATAQAEFQAAFEAAYIQVTGEVAAAVGDSISATFVIDDAMQQAVLQEGGLRAGLVDLSAQTTDAIFDALAEGRASGMTADNLARFIRDGVEAGPWSSAAVRARVIARTEGAHAANTSTLTAARSMPETEHVQVFDNRSGFDDPDCVAADGIVVTINEAEAMGLAHPNCTRAFVPINALLLEEMGVRL